jgi:hypothetical protein
MVFGFWFSDFFSGAPKMSDQRSVFSGNLSPKLLDILPGEFEPGLGVLDGESASIVDLDFFFKLADQQPADLVTGGANGSVESTQNLFVGAEEYALSLNAPIGSALWRLGLKLKDAPGHGRSLVMSRR